VRDNFDTIGNPISRMNRMYEILEHIVEQLETMLNKDNEVPELHESYYITPLHFEKIFHSHRSRSLSNDFRLPSSAED
jgi:hypothetical protein